jgi:replication factor C subunit 3/5
MQACRAQSAGLTADQPVQRCDWEEYLRDTARRILQQQSPDRLMETRGRVYELLTHCIPPPVILKQLALELIRTLDTTLKVEVLRHAAEYEHRMQLGSKPVYHIEAFVARFMSLYKRHLAELAAF